MPSLTTISVVDRETTPVTHTYTPGAPKGDVYTWTESDGVPIGDNKLSVSSTKTGSGTYKVRIRMADPVVVTETINGVDRSKVERTAYTSLEFTFGSDSTTQERSNLVGKLADLLASDQTFMTAVMEDLEGIY